MRPDPELKTILGALKTPPHDETSRARALHRSLVALANDAREESKRSAPRARSRLVYFAGVCTGVALAIVAMMSISSDTTPAADPFEDSRRMLVEVERLFPDQLNAVVQSGEEIRVDISSAERVAAQPLVVRFTREGRTLKLLSYSGRTVRVELDGREFAFEVLITGGGAVMLAGADFVWDSKQPHAFNGWKVEARPLANVL